MGRQYDPIVHFVGMQNAQCQGEGSLFMMFDVNSRVSEVEDLVEERPATKTSRSSGRTGPLDCLV